MRREESSDAKVDVLIFFFFQNKNGQVYRIVPVYRVCYLVLSNARDFLSGYYRTSSEKLIHLFKVLGI